MSIASFSKSDLESLKYSLFMHFLKSFKILSIIILFIWISFFPAPIQQKYNLVTKIFLIIAFAVLLINKGVSIFKRSDFPLWLFLVSLGINVLFAQDKYIAFMTYRDLSVYLFVIYYLVSEVTSDNSKFILLAKAICITSFLVALLGIFECLFAFNPLYAYFIENSFYQNYISNFVRPMSTQMHPPILGSYLIGSVPFNFLFINKNKSFFRFFANTNIVLAVVIITLTFSRGVFFGAVAMIVFYLSSEKRNSLITMLFIFLFMLVFVCNYLPFPIKNFGIDLIMKSRTGIFSQYRFNRYIMTGHIIKNHPFAGLGFQHFRICFSQYYPGKDTIPYEFMIADNMYLTILTETGAIGFLGFFIFIFSFIKKGIRGLKQFNFFYYKKRQLAVVMSAFIGLLVNMAGYELFYWNNIYILFCMIIGCLGGLLVNKEG